MLRFFLPPVTLRLSYVRTRFIFFVGCPRGVREEDMTASHAPRGRNGKSSQPLRSHDETTRKGEKTKTLPSYFFSHGSITGNHTLVVNRTYGTHKNLYISRFLPTIFWSYLL